MDDLLVLLDAGHGGVNPFTDEYVTAPNKMAYHEGEIMHDKHYFYEGVFNRQITLEVFDKLAYLGVNVVNLTPEYLDYPLDFRTKSANFYAQHVSNDVCVFVSNHSNAYNKQVRGYEIYTSEGDTGADHLAEFIFSHVEDIFRGSIKMRQDTSDGDHDKESNFYVLRNTSMPAVLVENLFFDNVDDALMLMNPAIVNLLAEAQVRGIIEYYNRMKS